VGKKDWKNIDIVQTLKMVKSTMIGLLLIILLVCRPSFLLAAEEFGEIHGTVRSERGERLKGAQVTIDSIKRGAVASGHGHYRLANIPAGEYEITARMTGYETQSRKATLAKNEKLVLDFTLVSRIYDLSPVVVTATLTEKVVEKVPAGVEVVSDEEMNEMGAETVAEALTESRGLSLQAATGRSRIASLRGLRANHTLVMIDGRRVSSGFRSTLDLSELPNSMIERIEIVRGPSSALYGSDAVGGVINIITRKPREGITGGISLRYGQSRYGEAESPLFKGDLSGKTGRLGYSFAGSFNRKDDYNRDKSTVVTDGDYKRIASGTGRLSFDLTPDQSIAGGVDYLENRQDGFRTFGWGDANRIADSRRSSFFVEYTRNFRKHSEIMLREYHSRFESTIEEKPLGNPSNWENPLTGSHDPFRLEQNLNQAEGRINGLLFNRHLITMGAEYRNESRKDNFNDNDVDNSAVFFQDEIQVSDPFLLVLGARYDSHSDFGSEFSPKLSAAFAVNDNFRIKGSYGEGFRAPTIFELYVDQDTKKNVIHANPELDSETSRSFEIGAEGVSGNFSGEIRFFRNDLEHMIGLVQTGTITSGGKKPTTLPVFEYRNIEKALTRGVEISATIRLPRGFAVSDEATVLDTEDKATGERIFERPDFLNNFKLSYSNVRHGLKANLRAVSTGGQRVSKTMETESYTFWHCYAEKKLAKNFEAFVGINNIFNSDPAIYGFVEGARVEGSYFYSGISASFR